MSEELGPCHSDSKAGKIIYRDEPVTFEDEEIVAMEILIFLTRGRAGSFSKVVNNIEPLELDPALTSEYIDFLLRDRTVGVKDQVEALYEEIDNVSDRIELLKAIKDPSIIFEAEEDENEI